MNLARLEQTRRASCCPGRLVSWTLCHRAKRAKRQDKRRGWKEMEKFAEAEERNAAGGGLQGERQQVVQCLLWKHRWGHLNSQCITCTRPEAPKPPVTLKTLFTHELRFAASASSLLREPSARHRWRMWLTVIYVLVCFKRNHFK